MSNSVIPIKLNINISDKKKVSDELMDLLLTADPNKEVVQSYLRNSLVLVGSIDNQAGPEVVGIAVLTKQANVVELKNIAVKPLHQGHGFAKLLINEARYIAKKSGAIYMEVGTGNSSLQQLALYQKCGFRMHHIHTDYFRNYPNAIYENGIRCIDMVKLRLML